MLISRIYIFSSSLREFPQFLAEIPGTVTPLNRVILGALQKLVSEPGLLCLHGMGRISRMCRNVTSGVHYYMFSENSVLIMCLQY